jgi:hypothetical protein
MRILLLTMLGFWPLMASAQGTPCGDSPVSVQTDDAAMRARVCNAVDHALETMARCAVPQPGPVTIEPVVSILEGCVALYHCGEERIEVLVPKELAERRNADGPFTDLTNEALFNSLITHELTHAAYATLPCPMADCRVTSEYLAYAMQIMSLSETDRAAVEARIVTETEIAFDEISAFLYYFAPERFVAKVWAHLNQRPDGCAYLSRIAAGQIRFENGRR